MSQILRINVVASQDRASTLISQLQGSTLVRSAEQTGDLMGDMPEDSSSSDLPDDEGPGNHQIDIEAADGVDIERLRDFVQDLVVETGIPLEVLETLEG